MRKEVLLAIVVGALLGLVVAFGIWRANQAFTPQENNSTPQPQVQEEQQEGLTITEPEDGVIVAEETITIKGRAAPLASIVILTNLNEIILQAGEDGNFEQEVELEGGANEITLIAYDNQGNKEEKTLTIVFSTEFSKE